MGQFGSRGNAYQAYVAKALSKYNSGPIVPNEAFSGGCGCASALAVGGKDPALLSEVRKKIIRDIAEGLKSKFGLSIDPNAELDVVIKQMKDKIPDPRKIPDGNEKSFTSDQRKQVEIARKIAEIVNAAYGDKIIDLNEDPKNLCADVAEILDSIFNGFQVDFAVVASNLRTALKNMKDFHKLQVDLLERAVADIKSGECDEVLASLMKEISDLAEAQYNRQVAMVGNAVNGVIGPVEADISKLSKENEEYGQLIRRIKDGAGTMPGGDRLAFVLGKARMVATIAKIAESALKKVGMSMKEFEDIKDNRELEEKLDKLRQEVLKKGDPTQIYDFIKAVENLHYYMWNKDRYEEHGLSTVTGGSDPVHKRNIEKRIKKTEEVRRYLFREFNRKMDALLAALFPKLEGLFKKMGGTIKPSEDLDRFVRAFLNLEDIRYKNITYALTGYLDDVEAREKRERFLSQVRQIIDALGPLTSGPEGDNFKDIKGIFERIVELIDTSTDAFRKGLQMVASKKGGASGADAPASMDGMDFFSKFLHSVTDAVSRWPEIIRGFKSHGAKKGGVEEGEISGSAYSLAKLQRELKYYYRVSKIKDNLAKTSGELKEYEADYEKLLGESVAKKVKEEAEKIAGVMKVIDGLTAYPEADRDGAKKYLEKVRLVKLNFYRTIQAVDLYLKNFTNAITTNPDDLKDVIDMLERLKLITKWFNEKSGDNLAMVFENFPVVMTPGADPVASGVAGQTASTYIGRVNQAITAGGFPASGYVNVPAEQAARVQEAVNSAVDANAIVKNVFSTFLNLGAKLGGEELYKKVFMTPQQIYKNISDYLKASALEMGGDISGEMGTPNDSLQNIGVHLATIRFAANQYRKDQEENLEVKPLIDFQVEDQMFIMMLKAMVAKVFTAIGAYNLFQKPDHTPVFSPIRMILGGAEDPPIHPEAVELYIRLPLLAEFYYEIFSVDEGTTQKIGLLPMFDTSPFSELLQIIFERSKYVGDGFYSRSDMAKIITAINNIRSNYGGKSNYDIIMAFVADVNRRYGTVKGSEIAELRKFKESAYNRKDYISSQTIDDIAILPDEGDLEFQKPAPSDRFFALGSEDTKFKDTPDLVEKETGKWLGLEEVKKLRSAIDKALDLGPGKVRMLSDTDLTFNEMIKKCTESVKNASPAERFSIVSKVIQSAETFSKVSGNKFLLFHEMVVAPLNVLYEVIFQYHSLVQYIKGKKAAVDLKGLVDLVETHSNTKHDLVRVSIDNKKFSWDFSGLRDQCEKLIAAIRENFDRFKRCMEYKDIERFEMYSEVADSVANIYNVERFMDIIFSNKPIRDDAGNLEYIGFDNFNATFNSQWAALAGNASRNYEVLADMIAWDTNARPTICGVRNTSIQNKLEKILYTVPSEGAVFTSPYSFRVRNEAPRPDGVHDADPASTIMSIIGNRSFDAGGNIPHSALMNFNQLIEWYLQQFYDAATDKIYIKAINNFANGAFSQAVFNGKCYPSVWDQAVVPAGALATRDFSGDAVLFSHLGAIMRFMLTDVTKGSNPKKLWVQTELSEVPLYMREKFRAYMPMFYRLFDILAKRCEILKQIVSGPIDKMEANNTIRLAAFDATHFNVGIALKNPGELVMGIDDIRTKFTLVLNNIVQGCQAMKGCCQEVMREVEDDPKFFEVNTNFINDYKNLYNKMPFMPFSSLTYLLNDNISYGPFFERGTPEYKFQYGTRGLFGLERPFSMEAFPGMKDLLDQYNLVADEQSKLAPQRSEETLRLSYDLLDHYVETNLLRAELFRGASFPGDPPGPKVSSFALLHPLADTLMLTEDSNQDAQKQKIVELISGTGSIHDRRASRIYNILDLNIMPINIHALMREVPLVNLFNYAYTFDSLVYQVFRNRVAFTEAELGVLSDGIYNHDDVFVKLLLNPYIEIVDGIEYRRYIEFVRGETGLSLGRPKFLGDQLLNKALMIGLVRSLPFDTESSSIATDSAASRGAALGQAFSRGVAPDGLMEKEPTTGRLFMHGQAYPQMGILKDSWIEVSQQRLDTKLVRNVQFLVLLQRFMLMGARQEVLKYNSKVIDNISVLSTGITEVYGRDGDNDDEALLRDGSYIVQ